METLEIGYLEELFGLWSWVHKNSSRWLRVRCSLWSQKYCHFSWVNCNVFLTFAAFSAALTDGSRHWENLSFGWKPMEMCVQPLWLCREVWRYYAGVLWNLTHKQKNLNSWNKSAGIPFQHPLLLLYSQEIFCHPHFAPAELPQDNEFKHFSELNKTFSLSLSIRW